MRLKSNSIFNVAAILPIVFGVLSALFMAYVFYWPPKGAYVPYNPQMHSVKYQDGYIRIHREYCINQHIPITITRDLIRVAGSDEPELRYSLPQTVQTYELGCHQLDRVFEISPMIPPGNYRLVFSATWDANPFRTESVTLPELSLALGAQQK